MPNFYPIRKCRQKTNQKLTNLKRVTGNVWWLNWICSIVEKFFRIHLRHIKRFYDVYLLSMSAKSMFKIMNLGGYGFRIGFFCFKIWVLKLDLNSTFWILVFTQSPTGWNLGAKTWLKLDFFNPSFYQVKNST